MLARLMRSLALAVCCTVATLVVEGRAGAEEPARHEARYAIEVAEPDPLAACGGLAAVRGAVEAKLRRAVFTDAAPDAELSVSIDASWRAHIVESVHGGPSGDRDVPLAPGDCAKSVETLAVVLAIMIGPPRLVDDPARAASPRPPPPLPPPPPPPAPPPPRWRASPVVEFAFGTGVLPHLAGGVQGGLVVEAPARRLSFLARGVYWPARGTDTAADADVTRSGVAAAACYAPRALRFLLAGCLGFEGGRLHSTSNALTRASQNGAYLAAFVEARASFVVFRSAVLDIAPLLSVQLAGLLRRDRFTYRDPSGAVLTLLQPAPIAPQGTIGIAVHFL